MAILFQNAFEAALLARWARIPMRIGYARDGRSLLLTHAIPIDPEVKPAHQVYYYLGLLGGVGLGEPQPWRGFKPLPSCDLAVRESGRVRGLQTHKKKEEESAPGNRTAVNISGITVDHIKRGDVVTHPGNYRSTGRIDASFRLLRDVSQSLRHNTEVKLFVGASEVLARVRLLGCDELLPGQEGWIQLETKQPVLVVRGDRYILRRPSPGETLGGGEIIDPHPKGRNKRFAVQTITRLESLAQGTPEDILLLAISSLGAATVKEVIQASHLEQEVATTSLRSLITSGQVIDLDTRPATLRMDSGLVAAQQLSDLIASRGFIEQLTEKALRELNQYHQAYPLKSECRAKN